MENEAVRPETGQKNILARYFTDMPIFFPLIGLFLLGLTAFEAWSFLGDDSVSRMYWLRPGIMLLYFIFWAAVCLARKWGALAFIGLTIVNVAFHLFGPDMMLKRAVGDLLFLPIPINLVFSFLILFFFRKLK
jgi:hypothetical protein